MSRFCLALLAMFACLSVVAESQPQPEPPKDVLGRTIDVYGTQLNTYTSVLGSEEWGHLVVETFSGAGEVWTRLGGLATEELNCARDYHAEFPDKTAEDYVAWNETEEGSAWSDACSIRQLEHPELGKAANESYSALYETVLTLNGVFTDARKAMIEAGFGDDPISAELKGLLREQALAYLPYARCVMQESLKKVPPRAFIEPGDELANAMDAAMSGAVCKPPAPAKLPAGWDTALPFDGYGQPIRLDSAFAGPLEERLGWWGYFLIDLANNEGETWNRYRQIHRIDGHCSREYRRQNPDKSVDDFYALYEDPKGREWLLACALPLIESKEHGPKLVSGLLAGREMMALVSLVDGIRVEYGKRGLGDEDEIPADLVQRATSEAGGRLAVYRCAAEKALAAGLGPRVLLEDWAQIKPGGIDAAIVAQLPNCLVPGMQIDAYGRLTHMAWELERSLSGRLGPEWAHFVVTSAQRDELTWNRLIGALKGQTVCTQEYQAKFPQASGAEHDVYLSGEEGAAFTAACTRRAMADPVIGKAVHDGILATIELAALGAPGLVNARQKQLKDSGRPETAEVEPGEEEAVQNLARRAYAAARCIFAEAIRVVPLEKILENPAEVGPVLNQLFELNVCVPEQEKPAGS